MAGPDEHDSIVRRTRTRSHKCQSLIETAVLERSIPSAFEEAILSRLYPGAVQDSNRALLLAQTGGPSQTRQIRDEFEFQFHVMPPYLIMNANQGPIKRHHDQ